MKKSKSAIVTFASLIVSIIIGVILQGNPEKAEFFRPLGTIYINLIKMIMVPLVFSSLIMGISSITDLKKIGKMGVVTIIYFMVTTALAVIVGLVLSNVFKPGAGIMVGREVYEAKEFPGIADQIVGIFPDNIVGALLNANMLQIIFAAIVIGIAIVKVAPKGDKLGGVIEDLFEVMSTITKGINTCRHFRVNDPHGSSERIGCNNTVRKTCFNILSGSCVSNGNYIYGIFKMLFRF